MAAEYGTGSGIDDITASNCSEWSMRLSNNDSIVTCNIDVKSGALNLTKATIQMSSGTSIDVRNGATMNVNSGSTITHDSGNYHFNYDAGSRGNLSESVIEYSYKLYIATKNNVTITGCTIRNNYNYGIHLNLTSGYVNITDCVINGTVWQCGIFIASSPGNILRNNSLNNNSRRGGRYSLYVTGDYDQDIDATNTVNGGTVYYNYAGSGATITDTNIGHVTIVDCSDLWFTDCVVHNGDGVWIRGASSNVSIRGGAIENNTMHGVNLESTSGNNITAVTIRNNIKQGIYFVDSSNNNIHNSHILNNNDCGIQSTGSSSSNRIINNTVQSNNGTGIALYSDYNCLSDNTILAASGQYALTVLDTAQSPYRNYIWRNNTANGEQVNYYYDEHDIVIESKYLSASNVSNAGKITLVDCTNVTIRNNHISNNSKKGHGIFMWNSSENTLSNNTLSNNYHGIVLHGSSENNITNLQTISPGSRYYGVHIEAESDYNRVTGSTIAGTAYSGMSIDKSDHNIIANSTISSVSGDGLSASVAHYTNLTNVTVISTTKEGVCISTSRHVTIVESDITANTTGVNYSAGANYTDVTNTRITAGTDGIHISQSYRGSFTNNTIVAAERGITLTESRDHNLTGNNVTNYTVAGILLLEHSTGNMMLGNDFTRNGSGGAEFDIRINDSNDCTIANNESTAANYTFYLTNDTRLATLDTVFNNAAVGYEDTSNLTLMWRIDVLCWDNYHLEPMWTNLTVRYRDISDYNESLCREGVTLNANGRLSNNNFGDYGPPTSDSNWLPVIEYKENVTGKTTYQPMNCTAVNRWDVLNGVDDRRYKNLTTAVSGPGVTILVDAGHTPNGKCYYCHDDKLRYADGTFKFPKTTHWTKYNESIMSATSDDPYTPGRCIDCHNETDSSSVPHGTASGKDLLYQPSPQLCYTGRTGSLDCHSASAAPGLDQENEFSKKTHHPLGDGKLACKACHDNHGSTYRHDLLKYYTNGINPDTGRSESGYNSAYYALCLVCHLEEKLVAKMVTEDDMHLQDYTNQTNFRDEYYGWSTGFDSSSSPINIHSPQGTGFRHSTSYNCYFCHNPHGSNNPATTRYMAPDGSGFNYTYVTNLTPPSETYPDGETNWVVLGLANWSNPTLNQGGGFYSSDGCGGCHVGFRLETSYFTYRTYVNYTPAGGAGCVECHDNDASAYNEPPIRPIVNLTAMKLAMHTDLSGAFRTGDDLQGTSRTFIEWLQDREYTTEQIANISTDNAICWACHSTNGTPPAPNFHSDRAMNPYKCPKCHGPEDSQPPHTKGLVAAIDNHGPTTKGAGSVYIQTDVGTNGSCEDCHAPSVLPSSYIGELEVWKYTPSKDFVDYTGTTTRGNVSHYGLNRSQGLDILNSGSPNILCNTSDCLYCHCNSTNGLVWGNAPDVSGNMYGADTSNLSECYTYCHVLPDYIGSVNETTVPHFHNRSLYAGGGPNCTMCHDDMGGSNPYSVQSRVNVTSIVHGIHANVTNNTIGIVTGIDPRSKACWGCHQSDGMEPQGMGDRNGIVDPSKKPWTCEDCHARSSEWNASTNYGETWISSGYPPNRLPPRIYTHQPNSTTLKTNVGGAGMCVDCHIRSTDTDHNDTAEKVLGNTVFSNTSHYGEVAGLVTPTTNCSVCHCNVAGGGRWGGAPQVLHGNTTDCTNVADGCYVCHSTDNQVSADFHASNLLSGEGGSDCLRCHGKTGFA
ncbi:MAG: NosD domain-containing protein, partial [Euryarchaeota archaeon]|nr:NosD domain-containing protein [Euryarchaeota archaeon]